MQWQEGIIYSECRQPLSNSRQNPADPLASGFTLDVMGAENDKPKSAIELAMERLRRQDAEQGVVEQPVTDEQRSAIADARSLHASKTAELEILHRSKLRAVFDPAERVQAEDEYRRELQRINDDLERKVRKIRGSGV